MTVPAILDRLREAGAAVSLDHTGGVRLASAAPLPPALLAEARADRAAIVAALAAEAAPPAVLRPLGDRQTGQAHWPNPSVMPTSCCRCCGGWRWWCEAAQPSGWRCMTCHPYPAVPGYQARVVTVTDGAGEDAA